MMDINEHKKAILDTAAIDRDWLRDHHWCAVPVAGFPEESPQLAQRIILEVNALKIQQLYRLQVELALPDLEIVTCTETAVRAFFRNSRLGEALITDPLQFIILCTPREFFIVAGELKVVEAILACSASSGLEKFRVFADDPKNYFYDSPGFRYYPFVYEYYRGVAL